jgi:hypothetical protein
MGNAVAALIATTALCISGAASAEVNYELFPGHGGKKGYPPIVYFHAWVLSYKESKSYSCVASYVFGSPTTPTLKCNLTVSFHPSLLTGANVKTFQALGSPNANDDEAQSSFFWQIDQATGQIQFCMPGSNINCVTVQIP